MRELGGAGHQVIPAPGSGELDIADLAGIKSLVHETAPRRDRAPRGRHLRPDGESRQREGGADQCRWHGRDYRGRPRRPSETGPADCLFGRRVRGACARRPAARRARCHRASQRVWVVEAGAGIGGRSRLPSATISRWWSCSASFNHVGPDQPTTAVVGSFVDRIVAIRRGEVRAGGHGKYRRRARFRRRTRLRGGLSAHHGGAGGRSPRAPALPSSTWRPAGP